MSDQVEQPKQEEEKIDEYDQSALLFRHFSQVFRKQIYALAKRKKKAPIRVLEAFLFQPFEEVELVGKEEKNLFDLCSSIIYHKMKIMEYVEVEKKKEQDMITYKPIKGETNE